MGWSVYLNCGDGRCGVDGFQYGSIVRADPLTMTATATHQAEMLLTYNYGDLLDLVLGFEFTDLSGMTGEESLPLLRAGIERCGKSQVDYDYWLPTLPNVRKALELMANWAEANPWGKWEIV